MAQLILGHLDFCNGFASDVNFGYVRSQLNTPSDLWIYTKNGIFSGFLISRPKKIKSKLVGYSKINNIYENTKIYYIDIICRNAYPILSVIKKVKKRENKYNMLQHYEELTDGLLIIIEL